MFFALGMASDPFGDPTMEPTTGLILRRITQTDLSVSAHKLATLILDGIAWKDGYNGLSRGTAAFTLTTLAEKMDVSRQYLSVLLGELEASSLKLEREKPNGKFAPWLFRFAAFDQSDGPHDVVSKGDDTSLSREESHKTIFSGHINIDEAPNVFRTCWAELIKAAKTALPCWNVDTQAIWERFLAFNRARGNARVPARQARLQKLHRSRSHWPKKIPKCRSSMITSGRHRAPTGSFMHRICAG
jgi:hypothetical protein